MAWTLEGGWQDDSDEQRRAAAVAPLLPGPRPAPVAQVAPQAPAGLVQAMPGVMVPLGNEPLTRDSRSTSTSVTRKRQTAEEKALERQDDALLQEELEATKRKGELATQIAEEKARIADGVAGLRAQRAQEMQQLHEATEAEVAKRQADEDAQYEQLKSMKPPEFWADASTEKKLAAGFMVLSGGLANVFRARAGQASQGNRGTQLIQQNIERDHAQWRQKFERQMSIYERAQGRRLDSQKFAEWKAGQINARHAAAYDQAAAQGEAILTKLGLPAEQIATQMESLGLRQKAVDKRMERAVGLRESVTNETRSNYMQASAGGGPGGKPPTGDQLKNQTFFETALPSIDVIMNGPGLSPDGARTLATDNANQKVLDKMPVVEALGRRVGLVKDADEKLTRESDKQYAQAVATLMDVANTYVTGAGQSDTEFRRRLDKAVVKPGDTPAVIQQKSRDLAILVNGIGRSGVDPAGNAAAMQRVVGGGGQRPQAPAAPSGGQRIRLKDGRTGTLFPDGTFEAD